MGGGRSADLDDEASRLERELVEELAETPPLAVAHAVEMFSIEAVQLAGPAASLEEGVTVVMAQKTTKFA